MVRAALPHRCRLAARAFAKNVSFLGSRTLVKGAIRRRFAVCVATLVALAPGVLFAQAPDAPSAEPSDVFVKVVTAQGDFVLDLDAAHAPATTANFLKYVDAKRFDGTVFYRAMHLTYSDTPAGLLQGGLRNAPGKLFPPVRHEPTTQTGIHHKAGTITMARYAPGTATADFVITISDMPALDADPAGTTEDARAGFAAFGHVSTGMDVVKTIWNGPRSATAGEGAMKGDMLEVPVKILSMRRIAAPQ